MATLIQQIDAMLRLPSNWDGYGAAPIQPYPAHLAREFVTFFERAATQYAVPLKNVRVNPTRIGGVQIEWDDNHYENELEIYPDGNLELLREHGTTHATVSHKFESGQGAVAPSLLTHLSDLMAA